MDLAEERTCMEREVSIMKTLQELNQLWRELGDIPISEDGVYLDQDFIHFKVGTEVEEVWRWFEGQNKLFIVGDKLNGRSDY